MLARAACLLFAATFIAGFSWADTEASVGNLQFHGESNPVDLTDDLHNAAARTANREDKGKDREFVIAPLPARSPSLGWTVAVPAMLMYKPSGVGEDDTTWISGIAGFYAENKSWGGGGFHRMSLFHDTWNIMAGGFYGDIRYDYYGIGDQTGEKIPIPLRQTLTFYTVEALYQVRQKLYVGLKSNLINTNVRLDLFPGQGVSPDFTLPDLSKDFELFTVAPRLKYDSRDVEFYPTQGWLVDGTLSLGVADNNYSILKFNAARYQALGEKGVLATRAAVEYADGNAPFFLYPSFGSGVDLRGYTPGTYRNRSLMTAQAEYRHRFTRRLGAAVFAGAGSVSADFMGWTETLYSYGLGLRWLIAPQNNMSLRVDFAWGKDDHQFYVGLGEAF
jgi:hypothetical protein